MVNMNLVCEDYDNFGQLLESDYHAASGLLYRLGIELGDDGKPSVELPWMNHELIVYPTEYDFGLYQLQDGLYREFGFADIDYGSLRDPLDFIDMDLFGKRLAEDFNNEGDRYIYLQDCVIESPYGFK